MDDFAEIVVLVFGDNAAGEWECRETINCPNEVRHEEVCIMRGIPRDELVNRGEIGGSGVGPLQAP
jgi:hypothetical protein